MLGYPHPSGLGFLHNDDTYMYDSTRPSRLTAAFGLKIIAMTPVLLNFRLRSNHVAVTECVHCVHENTQSSTLKHDSIGNLVHQGHLVWEYQKRALLGTNLQRVVSSHRE